MNQFLSFTHLKSSLLNHLFSSISHLRTIYIPIAFGMIFGLGAIPSFAQCYISGGSIGGDESTCGTYDPSEITNISLPTGGNGNYEYIWLMASEPIAPDASNATVISGATGVTYDPGSISQTTYYRRCARKVGCTSYLGESNDVVKEVLPEIESVDFTFKGAFCRNDIVFIASATGNGTNLTYDWTFEDAVPLTGDGQTSKAFWLENGTFDVTLTVSNEYGCSLSTTKSIDIYCASVGNKVFEDLNENGIQNAGEPGFAGVTASLYTSGGSYIDDETTDGTGMYNFPTVAPGDYYIVFSNLPVDYIFSKKGQGSDNELDSDADRTTGQSDVFSLFAGDARTDIDAGIFEPKGIIGDRVFYDNNNNGIQDEPDTGVEGVTVSLFNDEEIMVAQIDTDVNGDYEFTGLEADTYYLEFDGIPAQYVFSPNDVGAEDIDSDPNPSTGQTVLFDLSAGQVDNTWDVGIINEASFPVEFSAFVAHQVSEIWVELSWTTASELNNDVFEVEKSLDGTLFQSIGNVKGAGTTTESHSYSFDDHTRMAAVNFYRIKQTDLDGSFSYSEVRELKIDKGMELNMNVYPNPASNTLTLSTRTKIDSDTKYDISIMNLSGQVLWQKLTQLSQDQVIGLQGVPAGIYLISVTDIDNGNTMSLKFIKK